MGRFCRPVNCLLLQILLALTLLLAAGCLGGLDNQLFVGEGNVLSRGGATRAGAGNGAYLSYIIFKSGMHLGAGRNDVQGRRTNPTRKTQENHVGRGVETTQRTIDGERMGAGTAR